MVVPDEYRSTAKFNAAINDEKEAKTLREKIERAIEDKGWAGRHDTSTPTNRKAME